MHVQCTAPNQLFLTANSKNLTLKWCSLYCTKTVLDENQILPTWIMCLIALLSCITSGRNFNEHEKFMVKYGWLLLLLFSWVATTWTLSHQWLHFTILLISLADISRNRSFLQWDDRLRSIPIFFPEVHWLYLTYDQWQKKATYTSFILPFPSKTEYKWDHPSKKRKSHFDGTVRQIDRKTIR